MKRKAIGAYGAMLALFLGIGFTGSIECGHMNHFWPVWACVAVMFAFAWFGGLLREED